MILGERLGLRLLEEADLPLLAKWRNDPETRQMFLTPFLISISAQKKWYEGLLNDPNQMRFMAIRLDNHATVGTIGLDVIDWRNQMAEIGSDIVIPSERGHHFGLEMTKLLIRYAFEELNLHRLWGRGLVFNEVGMRKHKRSGFKQEGIMRRAAFINGQFYDVVMLAVLRDEWLAEQGFLGR